MRCDKTSSNRINHFHESGLRTVYNDDLQLLENDSLAKIHVRNLRLLAAELYKIKENVATRIMHEIFE